MAEGVYGLEIRVEDRELAGRYAEELERCRALTCSAPLFLRLADGTVGLGSADLPRQGPVTADFAGGALARRGRPGVSRRDEAVARACFGNQAHPLIFDATAGLGRDAFVCARLGATVRLFERNPAARLLLRNGLDRARAADSSGFFATRLILDDAPTIGDYAGDARPDAVYLDPMYPPRRKTALVKKEMRLFRFLIGPDADRGRLLELARGLAVRRVVMKNPKWAPALDEKNRAAAVFTENHRFDVYGPAGGPAGAGSVTNLF